MQRLEDKGAKKVFAQDLELTIDKCDILVISPGIPIDNPLPVAFRKQGKVIIGEEELGALFLRATAVAVTGTNGKTTTVSMIGEVLNKAGKNAVTCGNIGNPLVGEVENLGFEDYAVIEISSFQLETLLSLRPHIAVICNIAEDHLNRHYNMENYIYLKGRLIRNLRQSEYAVLNFDDETVRNLSSSTRAKIVYFSLSQKTNGAYLNDGFICFDESKIIAVEDLPVKGIHNIYNALATVTVAKLLSVNNEDIKNALIAFKGVKHRLQTVGEINGVTFIDDSKATNIDATIKAVESMTCPTVLLLGGKDKGDNYATLFEKLKQSKVVHAVLYGENRFKLLYSATESDFFPISFCAEFNTAVKLAYYIAKQNQTVLLSPASSSFDKFANYEERGDAFVSLVEKLNEY